MKSEIERGRYSISVHPECELKVKNAALIKRALKEIYALGGDYPLWREERVSYWKEGHWLKTEVNKKKGHQGKISFFVLGDDLIQKNF